jgi:hypothetical protein
MSNDPTTDQNEQGLPIELQHGRKVFERNLRGAHEAMAKGIPVSAIVSGLLGVVVQLANESIGPRDTRRLLMAAADANGNDDQ